jgi:hypothetical protein
MLGMQSDDFSQTTDIANLFHRLRFGDFRCFSLRLTALKCLTPGFALIRALQRMRFAVQITVQKRCLVQSVVFATIRLCHTYSLKS